MRRPFSFSVSLGVHGSVLAWVALGPVVSPPPHSLYDMAIRPHEDRLVWYKLSDRLPDIHPAQTSADPRPPRATRKFPQNIVAGARDDSRPPQLIWAPAPQVQTPKPLPLPNVVALSPPRPVRRFTPPPEPARAPQSAPVLPDAPQAAAERTTPSLPVLPPPGHPAALPFKAPSAPHIDAAPVVLPAVPEIQPVATLPAVPSALSKLPRGFVAPPRPSTPQPPPPVLTAEPQPLASEDSGNAQAALAIAGLEPVKLAELPTPPGSRSAAFSAGPKLNPEGGQGGSGSTVLQVPGLMVAGGAKEERPVVVAGASPTSPESLAAAARAAHGSPAPPAPPAPSAGHPATRVSTAPDPRLFGRAVYTMAIQMPNVTSYSGSWLVWFAERDVSPGGPAADVEAPQPLRKVDPKYIASAAAERVEGKVRLWAVIGKDGHVGSVTLLSHLDDRLDQSAQEALSKWLFQPARYDGVPVEVDAVFEVPFRLAPKPPRR
ncbi:MAG: TonB family protein [Bryobacteraceae bacterium]|jgi:TonB family protein